MSMAGPTKWREPTDAELFAAVAERATDWSSAHRAEEELYSRHVRYLYGALLRQKQRLLDVAGVSAEDLVQETFRRAFERAHTYQSDSSMDRERLSARTRAWLGRIAHHLLADALDRMREVSASPYLERVSMDDLERPSNETPELALMREALAELSEREQDVLRVTALYYRAGEHQRLPNAVCAELAARWEISSENVRAIRSRALKKLKQSVVARGVKLREAP